MFIQRWECITQNNHNLLHISSNGQLEYIIFAWLETRPVLQFYVQVSYSRHFDI